MPRGRPVKSQIRQNVIEILNVFKKGHGYAIYKIYREIFPECTREVIYYHLKKGVVLGEFVVDEIRQEKGNFSWGTVAEKKYYALGPNSRPKGDARVRRYFEKQKMLLKGVI